MTDAAAPLTHSPAAEHEVADPTPGMVRRRAVDTGTTWSGTVTTAAGAVSGWHHHGDHESTIYVVTGRLHMEYGPAGRDAFEAVAGDIVHVPPYAVHRESNPDAEESFIVVVRSGTGAPTVNVDGPATA